MLIININGAINSGKSTVSKILAQHLKSSCFIEVDDLLSDEEQSVLGLNRKEGWQERIKRLQRIIEAEKRNRQYENIVFAYPMTEKLFREWKEWEDQTTRFVNITLAPPLEICIKKRGERELSDEEVSRIKEMYHEGYHNSKYADLIIDNSRQTPRETTKQILLFLKDVKKWTSENL
jgi:shikimate kinase